MNIFEFATRTKMRFPYRGLITIEDLWDLAPRDLDYIFKTLNSELKQVKEDSLLNIKTKEDKELDAKIEIIKYIVDAKLEEKELKLQAQAKKERKQKILEILLEKQDADLKNKSIEELEDELKEIEELDN